MGSRLLVRSLGLISTLVLARLLVPEEFGLVAIGVTLMQLLSNLSDIGVSQTVVKFRNADRHFLDTLFTISAIRGVLVAAIMLFVALFAVPLFGNERAAWVFIGLSIVPFLNGLTNPKFHEFERDLDFSRMFILEALSKLLGVIAAIAVALAFRNFWAIIASVTIGALTEFVVSYIMRPYRPRFSFAAIRELVGFTGWLTGVSFIVALNNKIDALLMPRLAGVSATGIFYLADQLVELVTLETSTPIATALYPGLSEQQDSPKDMKRTFLQGVQVLGAIAFPIAIGCAFIAEDFVLLLLGEEWSKVALLLQVCAPAEGLLLLIVALQGYAVASGMTKFIFLREIVYFLIRTPIFIWGTLTFGLLGAAVAVAIGSLGRFLVGLFVYERISHGKFWEPLWAARRSLIASIAMGAYFLLVKPILWFHEDMLLPFRLALDVCLGAVFYLTAHFGVWLTENKPDGVERYLIDFVTKGLRRQTANIN